MCVQYKIDCDFLSFHLNSFKNGVDGVLTDRLEVEMRRLLEYKRLGGGANSHNFSSFRPISFKMVSKCSIKPCEHSDIFCGKIEREANAYLEFLFCLVWLPVWFFESLLISSLADKSFPKGYQNVSWSLAVVSMCYSLSFFVKKKEKSLKNVRDMTPNSCLLCVCSGT